MKYKFCKIVACERLCKTVSIANHERVTLKYLEIQLMAILYFVKYFDFDTYASRVFKNI